MKNGDEAQVTGSSGLSAVGGLAALEDPLEARLAHVLAGQRHADHYLTPLADPVGKSVLVVGSGAGTDVLWSLRHGAREVVGIDVLEQGAAALDAAGRQLGVDTSRVRLLRLPIEEAPSLGRRFDLVLSNNVFEHVGDLGAAFAACARLVEPGSGRVAVFSAPLYWSSAGSHLPHRPWEHLTADPEALRSRLLAAGELPPGHRLGNLGLRDYLDREISLNRARLSDFLAAIADSGLVALHLGLLPDQRLGDLAELLPGLASGDGPSAFDLAIDGIALELALPAAGGHLAPRSTAEGRLAVERDEKGREVVRRQAAEAAVGRLEAEVDSLNGVLAAVEASWSFRLGRMATAPGRWLRRLVAGTSESPEHDG